MANTRLVKWNIGDIYFSIIGGGASLLKYADFLLLLLFVCLFGWVVLFLSDSHRTM